MRTKPRAPTRLLPAARLRVLCAISCSGTNNESVYVYDMEEGRVVARGKGHTDDVNAVRPPHPFSSLPVPR